MDCQANILMSFFKDTVSAVKNNGDLSDWLQVKSGTGQVKGMFKDLQFSMLSFTIRNKVFYQGWTNSFILSCEMRN